MFLEEDFISRIGNLLKNKGLEDKEMVSEVRLLRDRFELLNCMGTRQIQEELILAGVIKKEVSMRNTRARFMAENRSEVLGRTGHGR